MKHPVTCIVPARMGSSRFPGKPLFDIAGVPLVVRSARRALAARCFERVVVATEDSVIQEACQAHGLESILTPSFPTGTDRVAWAARELNAPWVLNLQGDEPVFPISLLGDLCRLLPAQPDALWTAADLGLTASDRVDEDVVKVELVSPSMEVSAAKDFHRVLPEGSENQPWAIHVGVYGGSLETLQRFANLEIPPEETLRRIEPLRALAHGMGVFARIGTWPRAAVDRREHISVVLDLLTQEGAL